MRYVKILVMPILSVALFFETGYSQTISGPGFAAVIQAEPEMAKKIGYLKKIGISGFQPVEGIDGLIATLKDTGEPSVIRVEAARAIGRIGDVNAIGALQEASVIPSETVQLILSGFFNNKVDNPSTDVIMNANGEIGAAATVALERLHSVGDDAGQRNGLLNLIRYSDATVKREAALALAELGDERALPHLKELGMIEAHEKLKLLFEMKDAGSSERTKKLLGIIKTAPANTEEAARKGAAVSILAESGEEALPAVNDEIGLLGKKNSISMDELVQFMELATVSIGIGSGKSLTVFEKLQNHPDGRIREMSGIAIMLISDGVPAVKGGAGFTGKGLLKKDESINVK